MSWDTDPYEPQELSEHAYRITWERMSTHFYYRAYTPGGRLLDAGSGPGGHKRCRDACEAHLAGSRTANAMKRPVQQMLEQYRKQWECGSITKRQLAQQLKGASKAIERWIRPTGKHKDKRP